MELMHTARPIIQFNTAPQQLILNHVKAPSVPSLLKAPSFEVKPFIEANTSEINLAQLKNNSVIPVFSKDNERTIAHQEFIEIAQGCASKVFPNHVFDKPEIRV